MKAETRQERYAKIAEMKSGMPLEQLCDGIPKEFQEILESHMREVTPIRGTYRGTQQVIHYFDSKTGLNIMTDMNGNLVGGWKLSLDQIKYLLLTHSIK